MKITTDFLLIALVSAGLSACSPTKGYEGPELPPTETSVVTLSYRNSEIGIGRASMNGIEFSDSGIALLPGEQSFDIAIVLKQPLRDCQTDRNFDETGYRRCLYNEWRTNRKNRSNRYIRICNRLDYMIVTERCIQDTTDGNCSVDFFTKAGERYQIVLQKVGPGAEISVTAATQGSGSTTPRGECVTYRSKAVQTESTRRGGF